MNSNQRSQGNKQSDKVGNEKFESSSRGGKGKLDKPSARSRRLGTMGTQAGGGAQQQGGVETQTASHQQGASQQHSTDRTGSQTGSSAQSAGAGVHQSNDLAGGMPRSPAGKHLAADQKMDEDTGLSNTPNKQSEIDEGSRQSQQSNVGRRSDMTPD